MPNVKTTTDDVRLLMRPVMAAAVMALIGGEALQLRSPNETRKDRVNNVDTCRDVPKGMIGFGSSVIHITANGYPGLVYAHFVDERCRELFGFGLTMEGDDVVLKRKESKLDGFSTGYAYYQEESGRDMIIGDYAYELNSAYMELLTTPQVVHHTNDYAYVYHHSAKIYLSDLRVVAAWCGDRVQCTNGMVNIVSDESL